ncbi:MAG TPA: SpoIIE family protein phosphatase [Syntrophales bacterium]|nr:SpoIIE family protein phosphatase [Syntrophales bacterium]HQI34876.1 SpoIIE family protein phosphatase [Syntrophales bacterium]HRR46222.1 SpoIIE family protein phosphatase [Syntrophales bacterium]HRU87710.1 SpoIIE family protein phosphatase [Syntrophales bacterium]
MAIRTKLILVYGALAILFSTLFSVIGVVRITENARDNAARMETVIRDGLEKFLGEKAQALAGQIEIYLRSHPLDPRDPELRRIAVQKIQKTGYSGLHDGVGKKDGKYLLHPNPDIEGKSLSSFRYQLPALWEAIQVNLKGRPVSRYYLWQEKDGSLREKFFVGIPVKGTGCILFATVYVDEFYQPLRQAQEIIIREKETSIRIFLFSSFLATVVLILVSVLIARSFSNPIHQVAVHARRIGAGDLTARLHIPSGDELEELAEVLNKMSADLKAYITDLTETTAAKERLERELQLAREIQQSIIPHTYPPFPGIREFDIYGKMLPAKEVAGDFFDFFFIGPDKLGIVIGDVSGKGVPAALFMFMTRALIRVYGLEEEGPARTLLKTNRMLAADNETTMFVSVIYAEYDLRSGKMVVANGGHSPPLLCTATGSRLVESEPDPLLGPFPDSFFTEGSFTMAPGEALVFYTDGITEAQTTDGSFYGEKRLVDWFDGQRERHPDRLCLELIKDVQEFCRDAPQYDDITILAFRVNELRA